MNITLDNLIIRIWSFTGLVSFGSIATSWPIRTLSFAMASYLLIATIRIMFSKKDVRTKKSK